MRRIFTMFFLFVFAFIPSVGLAEDAYDPQTTLVALNMAIMSISRITSTEDRIVLDQEYRQILNNLKLGDIEADEDMIDIYEGMMDVITQEKLRGDESKRFKKICDQKIKNGLFESLSGLRAYGGDPWSMLGSFVVSATSSYFNYQVLKNDYKSELDESMWKLRKNRVIEINELNKQLLSSSWRLLRKYRLPDEQRLTENIISLYCKAIEEKDQARALAMFAELKKYFQAYPPFWFYYGKAAQNVEDYKLAFSCYEKFSTVNRPVLRIDPFVAEVAKNRLALLNSVRMKNLEGSWFKGAERDECKREILICLKDIEDNSLPGDWENNLVLGIQLSMLGDVEKAKKAIKKNIVFGTETEYSSVILKAIETDNLAQKNLPYEIRRSIVALKEDDNLTSESVGFLNALKLYLNEEDALAAKAFEELADQENPVATLILASMLRSGSGVSVNITKASELLDSMNLKVLNDSKFQSSILPFLEKEAEEGNRRAQFCLGELFFNGVGVAENESMAIKWFETSAEKGELTAQYKTGKCYQMGYGTAKDEEKAVKWYSESAKGNCNEGQFSLGKCYYSGFGVEKDYEKAVRWFRKAADQKDSRAEILLGLCYEHGYGVTKDPREAVMWYRKAAENGYARGQCNLGCCYYNGFGVEKDYEKAVRWFRKAADQKYSRAEILLGVCYEHGYGVTKDPREAVMWYRKAAENGYATGQYNLGCCYYNGFGVEKDYEKAVSWFRKAAYQEHSRAQNVLGICCENGHGSKKDYYRAFYWYRRSAENGYAWGQYNLGKCYRDGKGVDKNVVQAYRWFYLASKNGDGRCIERSREAMDGMLGKGILSFRSISDEQVQEAMRQANQ